MAKRESVPRPVKKSEYQVVFASVQAQRGWRDLCATQRNAVADAWDFLTRSPLVTTPTNYRLRGDLGTVIRAGASHERWQHKPTLGGDARIWFYVEGQAVHLEQVHSHHPNQTK